MEKAAAVFVAGYPDEGAQFIRQVRAVAPGLVVAGVDRQKLRDAIVALRRYPGVTGEFTFDRWGDPGRDVVIYRIKAGVFVPANQ